MFMWFRDPRILKDMQGENLSALLPTPGDYRTHSLCIFPRSFARTSECQEMAAAQPSPKPLYSMTSVSPYIRT